MPSNSRLKGATRCSRCQHPRFGRDVAIKKSFRTPSNRTWSKACSSTALLFSSQLLDQFLSRPLAR